MSEAASTSEARPSAGFDLDDLVARLRRREPRSLGRAVSLVEDAGPARRQLIERLYSDTGRAKVLGVTGPPGAGKSTLVDRLARQLRAREETVGILAVDPTSPFSGGAILGDRIRMQHHYVDPGVFIRSMATRGAMGGLARATADAVDLLDAAGFDWVLVETVGVGQDEVDVMHTADSVAVVTLPGLGDDIQAIKAGLMEIADVFVINKADREGVERAVRDLEMVLGLAEQLDWKPPIVKTVASRGEGIGETVTAIEAHREWLEASGELERRRRRRLRLRIEKLLQERVLRRADEVLGLEREAERAYGERLDPYRAADRLFRGVLGAERKDEAGGGR